jgi:hypothetical protein
MDNRGRTVQRKDEQALRVNESLEHINGRQIQGLEDENIDHIFTINY